MPSECVEDGRLHRFQPTVFGIRARSLLQESEDEEVGIEVMDREVPLSDLSYPGLTDALRSSKKKKIPKTDSMSAPGALGRQSTDARIVPAHGAAASSDEQ